MKYNNMQAKKDGLGKLAHQATPFLLAEMNLIIQSDNLDLFEPRGLVTLAMVLIITTMNVRVGEEMRAMQFCDFTHIMYNGDGTFAYVTYAPA